MNRRSLLRGLLALPLAPLAAKLLPEFKPEPWMLEGMDGITKPAKPHFIGLDAAIGSDQTSIWLVEWDNGRVRTSGDLVMQRMADDLESKFFYDNYPIRPLIYPQLSVQEKIRRAVRNSL